VVTSAAVDVRDAFRIFQAARGGTVALQGATLSVEQGEIVVVQGPSGSGKTTLLRIVAGFERLSAGSAHVLGAELARLGGRETASFRARNLGMLDQHYAQSLSPDLTCGQTVAMQLELAGRTRADAGRAADELLERVGLADRSGDRPVSLSGGEQQRVAVCACVAHRPRLLLADEPAGELDAENAAIVYRLLGELVRSSGASALVVSHDEAAASIADRILQFRDGRVVAEAEPGGAPVLVVSRGWVRLPDDLLGTKQILGAKQLSSASNTLLQSRTNLAHPVAELRGVSKGFGTRVVFEDFTSSFDPGDFTAVVGRSGTGKTTMLHLLAGLERPGAGEVGLLGTTFDGLGRAELAELRRRHIALVTQEPGLVPYLTASENVELGLQLRQRDGDLRAAARKALVEVGLEERLHARASSLSAGERERVAIARALAADVELVLVDEPTARLDEENARAAAALLRRAAHERGVAVVCATHDPVLIEHADAEVRLG
jgi:ABC-type lipoprotein export system ATPase subunit